MNQVANPQTERTIEHLSALDQERVAGIVEGCMCALEAGLPVEVDKLVSDHPDLEEPLRRCLASLQTLHDAMHGSGDTLPNHFPLPVDGQLGDFVLGDIIGRGGMGIVYSAYQSSLSRRVALKILPANIHSRPTHIQRFLFEAKAAGHLHHPNIVPVFAVGEEAGIHYYAMQLIDGSSIEQHDLKYWTCDGCCHAIDAAYDLAMAIQYAHDCGIIHRDIKPSNLLLDRTGHVWITDFGLARRTHENGLTLTGELVGTVNYMSPEQAQGKPLDERTDIYSLGITLYEILTGEQAFSGDSHSRLLKRIETEEPVNPRKLNPSIPFDLETIVLKAISKDREDRYSSAGSMASDLSAVRDGRPIAGRRAGVRKIAMRWVSKHQAMVVVGLVGLCATLLTLSIASTRVWLAREQVKEALDQSTQHLNAAQSNYWQSRNLLGKWNETLIQDLVEIPGAETVHSQMLADTIDYYESFLDRSTDNMQLPADITTARLQLATAYQQVGNDSRALENFELAFASQISSDYTSTLTHTSPFVVARNDLALVQMRLGMTDEAIDNLQQVIAHYDTVDPKSSLDVDSIAGLAAAHVNLAKGLELKGDSVKSESSLAKAEGMYRSVVIRFPDRMDLQSELGAVLDHRAVFESNRSLVDAIDLAEEAVGLHSKVVDANPRSLNGVRRMGASSHNYAVLLCKTNESALARDQFLRAIDVRQKLTRWYPTYPQHWSDFAVSLNSLAMLECQLRSWDAAEIAFEKSIDALRMLVEEVDNSAEPCHRDALAAALSNLEKVKKHRRQPGTEKQSASNESFDWMVSPSSKVTVNEGIGS